MCSKGSTAFIEPIRDIIKIMAIRESLQKSGRLRDDLLFVMGINNSVQMSMLLRLKIGDIKDALPGSVIKLKKKSKDSHVNLVINSVIHESLTRYLKCLRDKGKFNDGDMLFQSRKGGVSLSLSTVNALVKTWAEENGIEGKFGAASLRKTWGYHQRERFGVTFAALKKHFGHASYIQTVKYLGYTPKARDIHITLLSRNEIGTVRRCDATQQP